MKLHLKHISTLIKILIFNNDHRATAMIGVTYSCQLRCIHCAMANYSKNAKKEFSTEELIEIINKLPKKKIKCVYFFGGEPLIRKDIFTIINCARKRGFITTLDTNGYLLNKETVKKLKNAGLYSLRISIDSPYAEIHNLLRGQKNSFEKIIEGIKNCQNEKLICGISAYATKQNLKNGDLKKILLLGKKLKIDHNYIRILPPLPLGRWQDNQKIELNRQEINLLQKFCQSESIELEGNRCAALKKQVFYISPYGNVQPCCYLPFIFGNMHNESLESILKRMWKNSMFHMKTERECPVQNKKFREKYFLKINKDNPLLNMKYIKN